MTEIITTDRRMRDLIQLAKTVAQSKATVLIQGESGTGKELMAGLIHENSTRVSRPFVAINCAAIPENLLESELFGYERGAFTGAHRRALGQFEYAHKATIFLDEIGELPLALQAKLLHVLQDFRFSRIGGHEMISVDTRLIAATNRNLEVAITRNQFREDLYYRLNVVEVMVPALRERREEIPGLARLFLHRFNAQYGQKKELSDSLLARLMEHSWMGNVRELENVMRRFVVLTEGEQACEQLFNNRQQAVRAVETLAVSFTESLRDIARRGAREAERKALAEVLQRVQWNRAKAAQILKVSYKTLLNKITECGLTPPPRTPLV